MAPHDAFDLDPPSCPGFPGPAGWVAVVLEKAAVITIDRSRLARIRLCPGW
jgi:hypothetical protein